MTLEREAAERWTDVDKIGTGYHEIGKEVQKENLFLSMSALGDRA